MTSKLYDHCADVWDAMRDRAEKKIDVDSGSLVSFVYEGFLTELFSELNLGLTNYTPVMRRLVRMGCVDQLWRGSRSRPSSWRVIRPPTDQLFNDTRTSPPSRIASLEARVKFIEDELQRLGELAS